MDKVWLTASSLMVTSALVVVGAPAVSAQTRSPAPIVFAGHGTAAGQGGASPVSGQGSPASEAAVQPAGQVQTASVAMTPEARARQRISFIHPGDLPASQASGAPQPAPTVPAPQPMPIEVAAAPTPAISPRPVAVIEREETMLDRQDRAADAVRTPVAGPVFDQVGLASWYGERFHGRQTANGEVFDMHAMSAAHPSLPLPSLVQVVNLANNREVVVRVNDRGPFVDGRIIDLSRRAADLLDFVDAGETRVRLRYLGPAPVGGGAEPEVAPATREIAADVFVEPLPAPAAPVPSYDVPAGYFVQMGAFASVTNAERLKARLSQNLPVAVQQARSGRQTVHRVLVGPWPSRDAASAIRAQLEADQYGRGLVVEAR